MTLLTCGTIGGQPLISCCFSSVLSRTQEEMENRGRLTPNMYQNCASLRFLFDCVAALPIDPQEKQVKFQNEPAAFYYSRYSALPNYHVVEKEAFQETVLGWHQREVVHTCDFMVAWVAGQYRVEEKTLDQLDFNPRKIRVWALMLVGHPDAASAESELVCVHARPLE